MAAPIRPLSIMLKLPPTLAAQVHGLPWTDRRRPAELLHVTVLKLGDAGDFPPHLTADLHRRLGGVRFAPFRVVFDRVTAGGGYTTLVASEPLRPLAMLRTTLIAALGAHRVFQRERPARPHVTVQYRSRAVLDAPLDEAVSWTVTDFTLVESVYGETRHIERGRFPLLPPGAAPMRAA